MLKAGHRISTSRVHAEARALHVARVLEFGLDLTRRITQIPVPTALAPVSHRGIATLVEQEERGLFQEVTARPASAVQGHLFHLHLRERWKDKLRPYHRQGFLLMRPSRRDREALTLPRSLGWAYVLLRPVLVFWRYGRYLLRGRLD